MFASTIVLLKSSPLDTQFSFPFSGVDNSLAHFFFALEHLLFSSMPSSYVKRTTSRISRHLGIYRGCDRKDHSRISVIVISVNFSQIELTLRWFCFRNLFVLCFSFTVHILSFISSLVMVSSMTCFYKEALSSFLECLVFLFKDPFLYASLCFCILQKV